MKIGAYASRADAQDTLQRVIAALDVAEPLAEPVSPLAINPLKAAALTPRGPAGF